MYKLLCAIAAKDMCKIKATINECHSTTSASEMQCKWRRFEMRISIIWALIRPAIRSGSRYNKFVLCEHFNLLWVQFFDYVNIIKFSNHFFTITRTINIYKVFLAFLWYVLTLHTQGKYTYSITYKKELVNYEMKELALRTEAICILYHGAIHVPRRSYFH